MHTLIKHNLIKAAFFALVTGGVFINFEIGIYLAYIMVIAGALTAIVFGVLKILKKNENTKKTLYGLISLFVICIIAYLIADNEVLSSYEKYNITTGTSKQVGMGLYSFSY